MQLMKAKQLVHGTDTFASPVGIGRSLMDVPVIVTSGGHVINDCELAGNACFIAKPYDLRCVVNMMVEMGAYSDRIPLREILVA